MAAPVFALLAFTSAGFAGNTQTLAAPCVPGTLLSYETLSTYANNECSVGILNFNPFTFNATGTQSIDTPNGTQSTLLSAADIFVTPLSEDGLSPEFVFSGAFAANA